MRRKSPNESRSTSKASWQRPAPSSDICRARSQWRNRPGGLPRSKGIREGIVCGYSQLETCRTFRFEYNSGRPRLQKDFRRCPVLYVFLMHAVLGLIHVKITAWFPLTMQVYVNGHDFLANKLDQPGVAYALHDNAFTWIADVAAAQACADRFAEAELAETAGRLGPAIQSAGGQGAAGKDYYWVTDQAEYATDVLFKDAEALASFVSPPGGARAERASRRRTF